MTLAPTNDKTDTQKTIPFRLLADSKALLSLLQREQFNQSEQDTKNTQSNQGPIDILTLLHHHHPRLLPLRSPPERVALVGLPANADVSDTKCN